MNPIETILQRSGPMRSSVLVEQLMKKHGLSAPTARKRVSRVVEPLRRFPVPVLPKKEAFLYLEQDRGSERFCTNIHRAMRETNSVYAAALDALIARGGVVAADEFAVISGAPLAQKGQIASERVAQNMIDAGFIRRSTLGDDLSIIQIQHPYGIPEQPTVVRARGIAEEVLLDAVRHWARNLGFASYNKINIRGDGKTRQAGTFLFDLTGPSYLLPLHSGSPQPGFFVADVFADGYLDEFQIQFFIRKARMLKQVLRDSRPLAMLVAEGFTGRALTAGRKAGIVLATPQNLFGKRVALAISSLVETLKNAAAVAASDPDKLLQLLGDLKEIEGKSGNLRGILFNLICAHLARRDGKSIDIGVTAYDLHNGKKADIDVLKIEHQDAACTLIECKGKNPGGIVTELEIQKWLDRIPIFREYLGTHQRLREAATRFEIWTSGSFDADALALLKREKQRRTKSPIDWKDGAGVLNLSAKGKEKAISEALKEHFIKHPLAEHKTPSRMAAE